MFPQTGDAGVIGFGENDTGARASLVKKIPPSLPLNMILLVVPLYCGWKAIAWLSAWAYSGSTPRPNHQCEAWPKFCPPSLERKRSIPPAHTTLGSTGSTAMMLSYQP